MRILSIILVSFLHLGCASRVKETVVLPEKQCEEMLDQEILKEDLKVHKKVWEGAKNVVSYSLAGLGYTADFLIVGTFSFVAPGAVCSPILAAAGRDHRAFDLFYKCWIKLGEGSHEALRKVIKEPLGDTALNSTQALRCPDVEWMKESLVKVAQCHKKHGRDDYYKEQLEFIEKAEIFNHCK